MADVDIPLVDQRVSEMPNDMRSDLAEMGKRDLMFLAKGVLGYKDMTIPCHGPLCSFINGNDKRFKLILHPRDTYKTSVVTIAGNIQKVIRNPEERILIANESATNAERFVGAIRSHAESNRVFRALYSDVIPKDFRKVTWNDSELVFNRKGHYPEPTLDTIGMTGSVTSRHYTHMCFDDPISEEAVKSELVMRDVINRMSALTSLLVKPETDTVWLVGTRWALWDVYTWFEKVYKPLMAKFARGILEDGKSIFPELLSEEMIGIKRTAMGEYKFSCLMMNNPRNSDVQDLNVADLKFFRYTDDGKRVILFDRDGNEHRKVALDELDVTVAVDPAPAETIASDRNAISVVGVTKWNEAVVLESWATRCTPIDLINKLFEIKGKYNPRAFGIEGVAYQKSLKFFVRQEAERRGVYLRVVELKAQGKKSLRIRGLQPLMATGRLYVDPSAQLLRQEMAEFPLGEHDDAVDALSMQLQMMRGQLSPEYFDKLKSEERNLSIGFRKDNPELRNAMDLDPDEEVDPDFLPATWSEYFEGSHAARNT